MIRSMTGYGSATLEDGPLQGSATARGLNHRFLDVTLHLPRRLQPLETEARERVARVVARGRVEVTIQVVADEMPGETVVPVRPLVGSLVRALRELKDEFGLEGGVSVADVARYPGVLERVEVAAELPRQAYDAVLGLVERAVRGLDEMRRAEGARLSAELERLLDAVEAASERIDARSASSQDARRSTLHERVRVLVGDLGLDDGRLYQEVVRAVERHDVAEETQRLRSHAAAARGLLAAEGEAPGKRLDFLAQELMREANTVGSKAQDSEAIGEVVVLKAAIERFREQVQNVE